MQQTLAELKAQNAEVEAPEEKEVKEETPNLKVVEPETEPKAEPEIEGAEEKEEGEHEEQEDWLKEESSDDSGSDKQVPLKALINTREKLKGKLAGKDSEIADKDSELEKLRALVEKLKAPVNQPVKELEVPDQLDFDTTEDYQKAMRKYIADMVSQQNSLVSQTSEARRRQEKFLEAREKAVDGHYKRAEVLVKEHSISPEVYQSADLKVREAINGVLPDQGDIVTEAFIEQLGEGSEKVMYYLGRNEAARNTLINKLLNDKTGLSASVYLGELKALKASAQRHSSSNAPAPAARINGGDKAVSMESLKRKYDEAHKKGDVQTAFDLKRKAKAGGFNTKDW